MSQPQVCAIFLFNHKFEANVARLEKMYADRFQHRRYIMPFASAPDRQVLRVYELSWNFSGHMAQAAAGYVDPEFTHYAFIADDLILNPALDEHNLVEHLGIGMDGGYIKSLAATDAVRYRWPWSGETAMSLRKFGRGFDYRKELPSADEAKARFEAMGLHFPKPVPRSLKDLIYTFGTLPRRSPWAFLMGLGTLGKAAEFPLLSGYADFVVVPASAIKQFVHYCGVFAALNIFAEVAVPTALALSAQHTVTELEIGSHFKNEEARRLPGRAKGVEFWDPDEANTFAERMEYSLDKLVSDYPPEWLYVHPVKLSRFN